MLRPARIAFASLLLSAGAATAGDFSYDYVEGSFGETVLDGDLINLGGSVSLDKQFGLIGSLGLVDFDYGDGTVLRAGGLFHTELQPKLDLVATLELAWSDYEFNAPAAAVTIPGLGVVVAGGGKYSDDDLGFIASGGVRFELTEEVELEGKLTLTEVDPFDDGLGLQAAARYYMTPEFSAAVGLANDADFDGLFINARYNLK
jgi:hypothetical protein